MGWLVAILLVIVIIFGVSSSMQSYATAQQAQAQIEVARVAQVNAWGNLVTILILALVIVFVLAVIAIALLYVSRARQPKRSGAFPVRAQSKSIGEPSTMDPSQALGLMLQMRLFEMVDSMKLSRQLPTPTEEQPDEEPFHWLRSD